MKQEPVPVNIMGKKTEQAGLQAIQDFKDGKTTKVDDIDMFFLSFRAKSRNRLHRKTTRDPSTHRSG